MKKFLIRYYPLILLSFIITNNIVLNSLKITGIIYTIVLTFIILINVLLLYKYNEKMKFKGICLVMFCLLLLSSKNNYYVIFNITTILSLIIFPIWNNRMTKIILASLIVFFLINYSFIVSVILLLTNVNNTSDIYGDTHYYCENNYEIYSYSAGAMDKFHYSIGKHYEVLNINDIININYNERNEKTKEEYDSFFENRNCHLVGEENGLK